MIKSIIVAKSENNAIGKDNKLPWHLPADLKYFRATTMGHFIIMGRKTYQSTDMPLPGRTSIVVTRDKDFSAEGCLVFNKIEDAYKLAEYHRQKEIFILGGSEVFRQTIGEADRLYLTEIKDTFEADTFFPEIDYKVWKEVKRQDFQSDEKNPCDYSFVLLEKNSQ